MACHGRSVSRWAAPAGAATRPRRRSAADRLRRLAGRKADEGEEAEAEQAHRHPTRRGDSLVQAGEEQGPGDGEEGDDGPPGDAGRNRRLGAGEAVDRPEQDLDARRPVRAAPGGRVEGEEEDAEPEDPGEDVADHDVVGETPPTERSHHDTDEDAGDEEADAQVDTEGERCERAREGDVAERVAGEHLPPEHHEVADESGGEGDQGARNERIVHEWVREHVADPRKGACEREHWRAHARPFAGTTARAARRSSSAVAWRPTAART